MKLASKAALALGAALLLAVIGLVALNGIQPANVNRHPTPTPTLSDTPALSLTESPLVASSSEPSIIISYSNWTGPLGYDVMIRISITNKGYASFNASKSLFFVIYGDSKYNYNSFWTQTFGDWKDQNIPDGGAYGGEIAFDVVKVHTEALRLEYEDAASAYNIVYNPK